MNHLPSTEQLSLFIITPVEIIKTVTDPYWDEIIKEQVTPVTIPALVNTRVGAQVHSDTKKVAPQHDTHWIEKYWVERSSNKYWYYRYCWMDGRKKNRIYLGSVNSPKARHKKQAVEDAIADGQTPIEIKQTIRSWRSHSPTPIPQ